MQHNFCNTNREKKLNNKFSRSLRDLRANPSDTTASENAAAEGLQVNLRIVSCFFKFNRISVLGLNKCSAVSRFYNLFWYSCSILYSLSWKMSSLKLLVTFYLLIFFISIYVFIAFMYSICIMIYMIYICMYVRMYVCMYAYIYYMHVCLFLSFVFFMRVFVCVECFTIISLIIYCFL